MTVNPEAPLREIPSMLPVYNGGASTRLCCFLPHCTVHRALPRVQLRVPGAAETTGSTGTSDSPALPGGLER